MSTHTTTAPIRDDQPEPRRRRPFRTPVRGHAFATRPRGGAGLGRTRLVLRREPDNPADPWAVAVWAEDGGTPWRVGYLERAVAVRVGPRIDAAGGRLEASFGGWLPEPHGRWQRPVVDVGSDRPRAAPDQPSVRRLPPYRHVRPVRADPR